MGDTVRRWVALIVLVALVSGCEQLSSAPTSSPTQPTTAFPPRPLVPPQEVVATVNDQVISTRDVEVTIQDLQSTSEALGRTWEPLSSEQLPDQYDLHDVVDELVMAELRAQDAILRGINRTTEVQSRFWSRWRTFFSQEWVNAQLDRVTAEVSEHEVEQFYHTNPWPSFVPEKMHVRELVVATEEQAKSALVQLLQNNLNFATLAQQLSIRQDLATEQWVMRSIQKRNFAPDDASIRELDPVLEPAVFAIATPGDISSYVKGSDNQYHIFQLVERQEETRKPLTEVSDMIRNMLRVQKLSENSEQLRANAKVEVFTERLSNVEQK